MLNADITDILFCSALARVRRNLWITLTELSKKVLDEKSALQQASGAVQNLEALITELASCAALKEMQDEPWKAKAKACSRCADMLAACKLSPDASAKDVAQSLEASVQKVEGCLKENYLQPSSFWNMLKLLWVSEEGSFAFPSMPDNCPDIEQLLIHMVISGSIDGRDSQQHASWS